MAKNWAARKAAQRHVMAEKCSVCGSTERVERHHPDITKPLDVEILCFRCHVKADQRDGTRRSRPIMEVPCLVCGQVFVPPRTRKRGARLCGRVECRAEMGRRAAARRWGASATASTDCASWETESSLLRPPSPSESSGSDSMRNDLGSIRPGEGM